MINRFISLAIFILFIGCKNNTGYFYSPDKTHCISIIADKDIRYIIAGKQSVLPDSNFVKIDVKHVDKEVGDQIVGCWNRNNLEWIILMDNVKILENRLDTNRFVFLASFPKDQSGIPTLDGYDRKTVNCFSIGFEYGKMVHLEGSISQQ